MAIKLARNQSLTIVDGTLTDIFNGAARPNRLDTIRFCWMLRELGFDFIEINAGILKALRKLPAGVNFLFRIERPEDARVCIENKIKHCCIDELLSFDLDMLSLLHESGTDVMVEMRLERMKALKNLIALEAKSSFIKNIRVVGINSVQDVEWVAGFVNGAGKGLGIPLNLRPENKFSSAAAIAVEAVKKGFDSLTTVFAGDWAEKAYAAADEFLTAAKDLLNPDYEMNPTILSEVLKYIRHVSRLHRPVSNKTCPLFYPSPV